MASPLGQRIRTIFIDEFHDLCAPHPDRQQVWDDACRAIAQIPKQRTFVSATHPPHLHRVFLRKAHIDSHSPIRVIRASTDRPELAYYVLGLSHPSTGGALWLSTISLVTRLIELLAPDERILVFFERREEADAFSNTTGCAVYHSKLETVGNNTKAHNLSRWDNGASPVMAATTAAAQGVDRPYIKFVLIYRGTFGMVSYAQQGGRGGRGGRPSYVILLRGNIPVSPYCQTHTHNSEEDIKCDGPLVNYIANKGTCRRKTLLTTMDGEDGSFTCLDKPGCNRCDVCDPDGDMLKIVRAAMIPEPAYLPYQAAIMSSSRASGSDRHHAPQPPPPEPHVTVLAATHPHRKVAPNRAISTGTLITDEVGGRRFEKVRVSRSPICHSISWISPLSDLWSLTRYSS